MPAPCLRSGVRSGADGLPPVLVSAHLPFSPGRGPSVAGRPFLFPFVSGRGRGGGLPPACTRLIGKGVGAGSGFLDGQPPRFEGLPLEFPSGIRSRVRPVCW